MFYREGYALPKSRDVSLVIYKLGGKEVMRWNASNVASGIYFYRLQVGLKPGGFIQTKKMVLLK